MIQHIKTKGFKGFSIDEPVHEKTIYVGKNKSGKSSRSHAIALTLLGYIPFAAKTNKKVSDILNDFGIGDTMTTAIVCNDVEFERHYSRDKKGSVSQRLRVDKKKVSPTDYAVALSNAGAPRIVDVPDFMLMSDQKKIDTLFSLFPPGADLKNLDSKIDRAKTLVNDLQASERTMTGTIQRLTASKSEIEMPAGSLPEIRSEMDKLTKQILDARESLKLIEIDEAKETARAEQKTSSQAEFEKVMKMNTVVFVPGESKQDQEKPRHTREEVEAMVDFVRQDLTPTNYISRTEIVAASIQTIIDTMSDAGCEACAAMLVAKMELRKFKGGDK